MARKTECIAMLLAGGQGSRLGILTKNISETKSITLKSWQTAFTGYLTEDNI